MSIKLKAPIIDNTVTAWLGNDLIIYFTLPNEAQCSNYMLYKVINPITGESVLATAERSLVENFSYIATDATSARYQITIASEFLSVEQETFNISIASVIKNSSITDTLDLDRWVAENYDNISIWAPAVSRVRTYSPSLNLYNSLANGTVTLNPYETLSIEGKISFTPAAGALSDKLVWTQLLLFLDTELIYSTDRMYNQVSNEFNHILPYSLFIDNGNYSFKIFYGTQNGYQDFYEQAISKASTTNGNIEITAQSKGSSLLKSILVTAKLSAIDQTYGTLIIERALNEEDLKWDIVYSIPLTLDSTQATDISFTDYCVQPNVLYKYRVSYLTTDLELSKVEISDPVSVSLEDIVLVSEGVQWTLRYNPQVTNMKKTVTNSIVQTIGGEYPIVIRGGQSKYRTFTIGGLISYHAEERADILNSTSSNPSFDVAAAQIMEDSISATFITEKELNAGVNLNSSYETEALREKNYRDKVISFLSDNKVKLFRSAQEGLILISLSDVSFTAEQKLDRNIWSFTATATEIDKATPENILKYNISQAPIYIYGDYYLIADSLDNEIVVLDSQQVTSNAELIINRSMWRA